MKRARPKHCSTGGTNEESSRRRRANTGSTQIFQDETPMGDHANQHTKAVEMGQKKPSLPSFNISNLPNEITFQILANMGTRDLGACILTCRRWRDIFKLYPSLLLQNIELKGGYKTVSRQWLKMRKVHSKDAIVRSLKVMYEEPDGDGSDDGYSSCSSFEFTCRRDINCDDHHWLPQLLKTFPFQTLEHLDYTGLDHPIYGDFWEALWACEKLKTIRCKAQKCRFGDLSRWEKMMEEGPLQQCKLESIEFEFAADGDVLLDKLNLECLKILILKTVMPFDKANHFIRKASSTLEELQICAVDCKDGNESSTNRHDKDCEKTEEYEEIDSCKCLAREIKKQKDYYQNRTRISLHVLRNSKPVSAIHLYVVVNDKAEGCTKRVRRIT